MEPKKVAYVRVSTSEQDTALQLAAIKAVSPDLIFEEKVSGAKTKRSALDACLRSLNAGDTLYVWKLDRLGRTTYQLVTLVQELDDRAVNFCSLTQGFDTSTPMGKAMLGMLAVFAQFERDMLIERTQAGLAVARSKGHFGARPRVLTGKKLERARQMYADRPISPKTGRRMNLDELAASFGVSKMTLVRYCLHEGVPAWQPLRDRFLERNPDPSEWLVKTDDARYGRNLAKLTG